MTARFALLSNLLPLISFFPTLVVYRFINDEAIACELAGNFYLEQGKKDICLEYFMKAHGLYHEWGAVVRCMQIITLACISTVAISHCLPLFLASPNQMRCLTLFRQPSA